ncbi:4-hydroxy-2-oxovalerate aldolase [Carboxydothermus hydrogenoformans]|uniref:4-hydroxy-2-oxovalerate aldolase n=1 Tax=Carboxydothermus hydrogenoformans (strain ATCC BAA-161 / DSM 6008 / Z-2901) TaxID=246194 RepID=HOA_CARHZ|nr:4-hydroxy-2-oxovalerate aldolase [Carboxydothermus hydrogenoformans]Q3ACM0.1 RecName: Full=4-hydroxy-2-oxovalerate aldolase; Short=HOA; AltName: Full=4-hydroxy-2-keto-pentanoic acid aldolase; AltName: Full=4-hydroxy-2-oxopentanoate aldolase [Carboxydothermus hydrogenoformans Z-2901]ABB15464.1 4-hydroxy-2-oxovalerate aldolase [Carboxydothermus hydrogenoformans Z-2901]
MAKKIRIIDSTLRDGMHAVSHQFTPEEMAEIAAGLDAAGIDTIEVSHGDGLGGSSYNYGFAAAKDEDYLKAVSQVLKNSKLGVLLLPGIGTAHDLEMAAKFGAKVVRVATHCTEADIGEQHIKIAKELGMEAIGFLMMSHMVPPEKLVEQAKLFESYGADAVYITDSAGAMTPYDVKVRIEAVKAAVSVPVGFHAHNNLGLAIGNTLAAIEAGATYVDGTARGLGAGAGNSQTEILVAVLAKLGYETGVDLYKIMDVAEEVVAPKMRRPQIVDKAALSLGYAGVYGSFLLHAMRAAEKFKVDVRDILIELGRLKTVGGQEDMIVDVAYELSKANKQ